MATQQELSYRQLVTLRDGTRVLLRPLTADDRQGLIDLFVPVPSEERKYMRHDVSDRELVGAWAVKVDYTTVLPVVAVVGDRIVGEVSLHFGTGPARHRAEVRIFLARDFRRRGLATRMIQAVTDLSRRRNLYLLEVYSPTDRTSDIKAFMNLGFELLCSYTDYMMLPDGDLCDVTHLGLRLRKSVDEF